MMIPSIGVYEKAVTQVVPAKPVSRAPSKVPKVRRNASAKREREEETNAVPQIGGLNVSARAMEAIVYLSVSSA
jgi:hypothetical protein